jgi:uncharacterized membrane protein
MAEWSSVSVVSDWLKAKNLKRGLFRLWLVASIVWMFSVIVVNIDAATYWFDYQFDQRELFAAETVDVLEAVEKLEAEKEILEDEYRNVMDKIATQMQSGRAYLPSLQLHGQRRQDLEWKIRRMDNRIASLRNSPPRIHLPNTDWLWHVFIWPLVAPLLLAALYRLIARPLSWVGKGFSHPKTPE